MKKSLLATAAAAAIALMATAAQAQVAGHVGASYARTTLDVDGAPNPDLDNYVVDGAFGFGVGNLNALVDATVAVIGGDVDDTTDYTFTGHLNGKLGNALVGGFGGVYATDDLTVWGLGAEGQVALSDQISLYGQAGYGYSDELGDADLWAVRAELRYFVNDNIKLQGSAGWSTVDSDVFSNEDTWNVGVEGEYQFAGTPWSVLAGYDYADFEGGVEGHTFRIGGRYTFGGATLKARDAAGADLGSVRKLFGLGF